MYIYYIIIINNNNNNKIQSKHFLEYNILMDKLKD